MRKFSNRPDLILTFEEHSIIGGLGNAVSEYLNKLNHKLPLLALWTPDEYGAAGEYKSLPEKRQLLPSQIANTIMNRFIQSKCLSYANS